MEDEDIETSLIYFAETILGFSLYGWQIDVIEAFDSTGDGIVMVSLVTPNGSGKSSVIIPVLVLGFLFFYPRARAVLTTADGKQLDGQVMPAIYTHRGKFPSWTFLEREIRTPTGGRFTAFTTDDPGRAEGWHKENDLDGPLLAIVDEAKTVPDVIFDAINKGTYNALLYVSSPGRMTGRFYESQTHDSLGFYRKQIGLNDCPHIDQEKIDRIEAQYGPNGATPNPEYLRSTLHGEFMADEGEARFNRAGLDRLKEMAKAQDKLEDRYPEKAQIGWLEEGVGAQAPIVWTRDEAGPYWIIEAPIAGCQYIGFCDPATGAQAEGSETRDGCSGGILRLAYTRDGIDHPDEPVAYLHGHNGTPVHWDNDVVSEALDILLRFYGDPPVNVEANNAGVEVIRLLQQLGRSICRRRRRDHKNPGKLTEIVGFQTTAASKMEWVGAIATVIREQTLDCRYSPAVSQLSTFILDEKGRGAAQAGCHDDHVTGLGLALLAKHWAKLYVLRVIEQFPGGGIPFHQEQRVGGAWS